VEVIGSGKHSSLSRYGNNYCRKSFIVQAPGLMPYRTLYTHSEIQGVIKSKTSKKDRLINGTYPLPCLSN